MPEPRLVELPSTAAEALLGARSSTEPGITPDVIERRAMAEKLRTDVAKDISPRQIAEGLSPHPPPTEGEIKRINNENIGIKRKGGEGPDAGEKDYSGDASAEVRRKAVDRTAMLVREVLDKGYDGIAGSDGITKAQKQNTLVKSLIEVVNSWPEGKAVFDSLNTSERRQRIEEIFLRNPQFLKKLKGCFGEIYNGEGAVLKDLVTDAEDEFELAKKAFNRKSQELEDVTGRINDIAGRMKDFTVGGKDYERFNEYDFRKKRAFEAKQNRVAYLKERQKELEGSFYKGVRFSEDERREMLRDTNEKLDRLEGELEMEAGNFDEWSKLQQEKELLDKELAELKSKEPGLQGELDDLDTKKQQAERKRNVARAARVADEEVFAREVVGMVKEAGMRHYKSEVERYEASQKTLSQKAIEEAEGNDEKVLEKKMASDWRRKVEVGMFSRRTVEKVDKDSVRTSYQRMINERSMDWYVRNAMNEELIEFGNRVGIGSAEYREEYQRVQDRLKDKEFMKKMSSVAAERLMKNYFESGQKPKREDLSILVETDWGKDAIEKGLAKRQEVDALVDKMKQINGFSGSKGEFLRALAKNPDTYKKGGLGLGAIIALIFGAPFLVAGAGALAAGYSAARGAIS